MANPSSSHHDRDHERRHRSERERSSSHHHHRTISSTTLLLVLSLILAVLAVMLSLPSQTAGAVGPNGEGKADGLLGYLTPKRTQALIARETQVAIREAEVARREAELLAGAPGGVIPSPSPAACPPCPTVEPQIQTVVKEVVKEEALTPPGWWKEAGMRADDILDRELKMADREREISKREENVNRREHDASRREGWIMEQLIALGNEQPQTVEDEYEHYYEPAGAKQQQRKAKALPPVAFNEPIYETKTVFETMPAQTVTVPAPANTRLAAFPTPEAVSTSYSTASPRTTAVETIITEEEEEYEDEPVNRPPRPARRPPARWFGGW